jgi:hypothetical protein
VGEKDLYFGGTSTKNFQGLGARLAPAAEKEGGYDPGWEAPPNGFKGDGLLLVPVEALYDHGITVRSSEILKPRLVRLELALNPQDAAQLELEDGATAEVRWNGRLERLPVRIDHDVPQGVALAPRSSGLAISKPEWVDVGPAA